MTSIFESYIESDLRDLAANELDINEQNCILFSTFVCEIYVYFWTFKFTFWETGNFLVWLVWVSIVPVILVPVGTK